MEQGYSLEKKFSAPHEEVEHIQNSSGVESQKTIEGKNTAISNTIKEYISIPKEEVLHEKYALPEKETERIVLDLNPEPHDEKMNELVGILKEKGIYNTLTIVDKLSNPHIADDFHRFLVEYVREGYKVTGLKDRTAISKSLRMSLYEIDMPDLKDQSKESALKQIISSMEQFYAGMLSVKEALPDNNNYFSIELAIEDVSSEFVFYTAVPQGKEEMFEKHIHAVFPNAKVTLKKDDYNIFNEHGVTVSSYATSARNPIFPIKTYEQFDTDPLNTIISSFSKIDHEGEGAAIQLIIRPADDAIIKKYKKAIDDLGKGIPVKKATDITYTAGSAMKKEMKEFVKGFFEFSATKKDDSKKEEERPIDNSAIEEVQKKISSPILETNIRIIASSRTQEEAVQILADMQSAFNQFENTKGNRLTFKKVSRSRHARLLSNFSYRRYDPEEFIPLNIAELTSLMHFETSKLQSASQLRQTKSGAAPAPLGLSNDGIILGKNVFRGKETTIRFANEDRLRHFYIIGQTGTGKSTLIKNMIVQDIARGEGVCMIDPHGVDVQDVVASIPKERYEDLIYFDPSYTARPMGLNMLEYDPNFPEQKTFVVNELFSIFQKLYGGVPESMGPMFEQYFRNATMLVIEDPASGCTLLDVSKVLSNKAYRQLKLSRCKNPIVVQFWREVAEKAGGEASLANIVPYITSKFDVFLANDIMRPIVAQEHSVFDFRKIMDEKKILLVNLAKGRLGDINSNLIGLILVGKILMATLSRVDSYGKDFPPFNLYIDEFQNVTTNSISTILSEARKYKLGLTIAHQFIAQLEEGIRDSVFGNVGSLASFRVGSDDAEYLAKQFEPTFKAPDLMNVDNRNAFVRLLSNGRPVTPFNIEVLPPTKGIPAIVDKLKELSYLKYGEERAMVESEIAKKYS